MRTFTFCGDCYIENQQNMRFHSTILKILKIYFVGAGGLNDIQAESNSEKILSYIRILFRFSP